MFRVVLVYSWSLISILFRVPTLAHGDSAAHPGVLKQGDRCTLVLIQAAVCTDVVQPVPEATVTEWIFISLTKPDPICFWMEKSY